MRVGLGRLSDRVSGVDLVLLCSLWCMNQHAMDITKVVTFTVELRFSPHACICVCVEAVYVHTYVHMDSVHVVVMACVT